MDDGAGDLTSIQVKRAVEGSAESLEWVIAHLDPEVLIVDEALAVGDVFFQHKCMRRIGRLIDSGATLLFVSHGPDAVKRLCRQALWLDDGRCGVRAFFVRFRDVR